jgi:hypothetical protein
MSWTYLGTGELAKEMQDYEDALVKRDADASSDDDVRRVELAAAQWESFNKAVKSLESNTCDPRLVDDLKAVPGDGVLAETYVFSKFGLNLIYVRDPLDSTVRATHLYPDKGFLEGVRSIISTWLDKLSK